MEQDELGTGDVPGGSAADDEGHWQMSLIIYSNGGAGALFQSAA